MDIEKLEAVMLETYQRELDLDLNDPARLKAVYGSEFWNLDLHDQLQSICRTASMILNSDNSTLSLVTENNVVSVATTTAPGQFTTPFENTFCQHVLGTRKTLSVADSLKNALVCNTAGAVDGTVKSYLGVPLMNRDGYFLGSLCVFGAETRNWTEADVMMLTSLASVAMRFVGEGGSNS